MSQQLITFGRAILLVKCGFYELGQLFTFVRLSYRKSSCVQEMVSAINPQSKSSSCFERVHCTYVLHCTVCSVHVRYVYTHRPVFIW